ncbi:hypothetical protein MIND_01421500 [Mycena indigotica]|uniref:NmrA-like domain-containing protein n=1 Tax=Mycena indigotica TaxID=2126181 RepID=A0A8H6RZZ5_9AGAR|nr:uncharacterized protein MIND_01421500 [Mycena indigotica]KAF7288760.1 hypothetical protein MIND_01421500 [Mycena indigotica]
MTITKDPAAPLVAVVGATGTQGGSVVLALTESERPYRIRAFTRNVSKPAAKALAEKGLEVVAVTLSVENRGAVFKAFEGADYAFLVTNWAEHGDPPRETVEGKLMIDAAKAAGVKGIVWSGLPSIDALSGSKYKNVGHFESKARVSDYGRASGVPFVDIQAGGQSLRGHLGRQRFNLPLPPTTRMPIIDAEQDYGLFVRKALELPVFPDKQTWATFGELIGFADQTKQLSEVTGKNVVFNQIPSAVFGEGVKSAGTPPHIALAIEEVFTSVGEFGYFSEGTVVSQEGLARQPQTWKQYVEAQDWSDVLV